MFPNAYEIEIDTWISVYVDEYFESSVEELQAILKRTDNPLIFQDDETGTLKAIVRKSQMGVSGAVQQRIWYRDGFQCMYCGKKITDVQLTIDHFQPLEKGGVNNVSNYLSACRSCNKRKGNTDPVEYCAKYGLDWNGLKLYLEEKAPKSFIGHLI